MADQEQLQPEFNQVQLEMRPASSGLTLGIYRQFVFLAERVAISQRLIINSSSE
ncbi:hypothetical protein J6590_039229 [Homalodisca vitripennis]|nr:hypothetical protein J6590_039229 [Homalodisca vitripennis]